jgi:peptidoglycan/LPS O-acetylase OafA/YrhL
MEGARDSAGSAGSTGVAMSPDGWRSATDGHVAALDGIRAVAVIAVLLFHAGVAWAGGGMLGVDMFFALSGFLITSLLVDEYRRSGTVRFSRFYERRARRLLPALLLTLLIVAAYANWFAEPDLLGSIRGDALSTLFYVSNWHFVFSDQGYFVHFGPSSPLLHTWSLAVEEQFYLVWPLVSLLVLRWRGRRVLAAVAASGVVASVALTATLFAGGVGNARLYYGSDARAQAVLVGACLGALGPASAWFRRRPGWSDRAPGRRAIALCGLLGAVGCLWAIHAVPGDSWVLYHGGFAVMGLATGAVITAVVAQPRSFLDRALSWGALTYVGRISYGLYLYHWPVFLMLDSTHTGLLGWRLLACRLAVTGAVAICSYHLVEEPVRQRRFVRTWRAALVVPAGTAAIVAAVVISTVTPTATAAASAARTLAVPSQAATARLEASHGLARGQSVHTLILGDSLALTLGVGLGTDAQAWGVHVDNGAVLGCDLDPNSTVNIEGNVTQAAQGCADWRRTWAADVRRLNPDVVAIELGRWEVSDRIVDGRWTRIGARPWDDLLGRLLNEAIALVSNRGAKVVLFTLPYIQQTTEQPNGEPWPINRPSTTNGYNELVRRVAARHPGVVSVIDLNRLLDPAGHYTSYVDGVRVRNPDDEHPSTAGGELLRPVVLPQLLALGSPHLRERVATGATASHVAKFVHLPGQESGPSTEDGGKRGVSSTRDRQISR